jgi:hypothetical protein
MSWLAASKTNKHTISYGTTAFLSILVDADAVPRHSKEKAFSLAGVAACTAANDGSVCCIATDLSPIRLFAVNIRRTYSLDGLLSVCNMAGVLARA